MPLPCRLDIMTPLARRLQIALIIRPTISLRNDVIALRCRCVDVLLATHLAEVTIAPHDPRAYAAPCFTIAALVR